MRPLPAGLTTALSICLLLTQAGRAQAPVSIVANGQSLTVTTSHAVATFAGADLVGFQNSLTGETYLRHPSAGTLATVDAINGTGQPLQPMNWSVAIDPGTGVPVASITLADANRTLMMTVRVDPVSDEIVVRTNASTSPAGLRGASWALAGLDLTDGRLIVPAATGRVFDAADPGVGAHIEYPNTWHAQMAVYEAAAGSFVIYATDPQMWFKRLHLSTRGQSTIDVGVATNPIPPYPSATTVPEVEWRLKAFAGGWQTAAQPYRDWLAATRPPISFAAYPWVADIRAIVGVRAIDPNVLSPLAAALVPSKTLLYIHDWRASAYDVNYPDYTPRAGVSTFIASAKTLGFRVMLHTDLIGVSPTHPDYATVQAWHVRTPETLELMGWRWELPPSTPYRFAFINPAAATFRALWISRVAAAVAALQPDALHLDISGPQYNDGNGVIESRTYPQGSAKFHDDVIAAFPNVALGGEGENDITYRYHAFAQMWSGVEGAAPPGHPITAFLFSPTVQYYGHLSQPAAGDPTFKRSLLEHLTRGVAPQLPILSAADLDTSNPDNARLIGILQSWQTHGFRLAAGNWGGDLVRFTGAGGAAASLTDTGSIYTLAAAGSVLAQIAHDSNTLTSSSFVRGWPAFDDTTVFGLDPARLYWLDPVPRPAATHLTSLPAGIRLGSGTLVGPRFAHVELESLPAGSFDAVGDLLEATTGVTFQNADAPLGNGAVVQTSSIVAGGEARFGLFVHPPWQGQIGGETFVEYDVTVPPTSVLRFAVGVADNASCTDGVTFRVTANGTELWSQHVLRTGWQEATVSLAAYAGTTMTLRLISHPGPNGNPNCDWSLWNAARIEDASAGGAISTSVSLASGSVVSGFEGDGLLTMLSPLSAQVTNVPVPGRFTIFTAAGSPVSGGSGLTALPFETWVGAHDDMALPGSVFGAGGIGPQTAGGVVKNPAIWSHPPNGGRTIHSWVLQLPAATPLQLDWSAGIADGATSEDGVDFEVRVNGVPYWRITTSSNLWIPGTLNLAPWAGRNILLELITDSRAAYIFDWAAWADLVLQATGAPCSYSIPPGAAVGASGASLSFAVTTSASCPWSASTGEGWISISSGSGAGDGVVEYLVAPNWGAARTGEITVGGQTFVVSQAAGSPGLVANGGFDAGLSGWLLHATPDLSYISATVVSGVLEFYRQPPPPGTANQATVFQETGIAVAAGAGLEARFDLGNSSAARKRISVLVLAHDFSDLSVCTFWLAPGAPLRTYRMRTHTTQAWTSAAIYFYAATPGSAGGAYLIDNVSLHVDAAVSGDRTDCIDPTAPAPAAEPDGPALLANGDFSGGSSSWLLFGQIVHQIAGGVFEFYRPPGTPAGVVFQGSGQALAANQIVTASFHLGNSSAVRKRVTVLLHDLDFSDLTACTFWLPPGQPLSPYRIRSFATEAWTNATVSVYPATVGTHQWIRLDNVALQRTPSAAAAGTECEEPGALGSGGPSTSAPTTATTVGSNARAIVGPPAAPVSGTGVAPPYPGPDLIDLRHAAGARLAVAVRLPPGSRGELQISLDGVEWFTVAVVDGTPEETTTIVDLEAFGGHAVGVRFVVISSP